MASKLLPVRKRKPRSLGNQSQSLGKPLSPVVSAYKAKTYFSMLLGRASNGESITITKHGHAVARLSPTNVTMSKEEAAEGLKTFWKGNKAKVALAEIMAWKNEGRR
jgi:prevent-host-death family protein